MLYQVEYYGNMGNVYLNKKIKIKERIMNEIGFLFVLPGMPAIEQFRSGIGWNNEIPVVVERQLTNNGSNTYGSSTIRRIFARVS